MKIREYDESDWSGVWSIIQEVLHAADTFAFEPDMTEQQAYQTWITTPPGRTVVAMENNRVLATAKMGPNRPGPGAHISTASFMVAAQARGRGVWSMLCREALRWARQSGYVGMQFNAVVESNKVAVDLYRRLGFHVVGTVPGAFAHPTLGYVDLHIMYCSFDT